MSALSITILICAAGLAPRDCRTENAIAVVHPAAALYAEYSGMAGCQSFATKFAASLHYVESGAGYPKIRCALGVPAGSVG